MPRLAHLPPRLGAAIAVTLGLLASACGPRSGPRDVSSPSEGTSRRPSSSFDTATRQRPDEPTSDARARQRDSQGPRPAANPSPSPQNTYRVIVHGNSPMLSVDDTSLYFTQLDDGGLYATSKAHTAVRRLALRGPIRGTIALSDSSIAWVASPGDTVMRLDRSSGHATDDRPDRAYGADPIIVRQGGTYVDVALANHHTFVVEATGNAGVLSIASSAGSGWRHVDLPASPRAVIADTTHVYVVTLTQILRALHDGSTLEVLATGQGFVEAHLSRTHVYVRVAGSRAHTIAEVPKEGGALRPRITDARDACFDVSNDEVTYASASEAYVYALHTQSGVRRSVLRHEAINAASCVAADSKTVYVATSFGQDGTVFAVDRPPP